MDEHDVLAEEIRDLAYEISQSEDAGTPEENWSRAEEVVRRRDVSARAVLEIASDDGWSELDDEEHAALEAIHERSALS